MSTTPEMPTMRSAMVSRHAQSAFRDPGPIRESNPVDRVEELANTITHGVGMVLSLAGLFTLIRITGQSGIPVLAVGCAVYGGSLVLLYTASTLYHGCRHAGRKRAFLVLDHIGIYALIAGTYTPVALIPLRGQLGWSLLVLVWGIALAGSLAKVHRIDKLDEDSPLPYIALSWMVLATAVRIAATVPPGVIEWLLAGGFFYTVGIYFFVKHEKRFYHAIWHLFVIAGSTCHYRAVLGFTLPMLT